MLIYVQRNIQPHSCNRHNCLRILSVFIALFIPHAIRMLRIVKNILSELFLHYV